MTSRADCIQPIPDFLLAGLKQISSGRAIGGALLLFAMAGDSSDDDVQEVPLTTGISRPVTWFN